MILGIWYFNKLFHFYALGAVGLGSRSDQARSSAQIM